MGTGVGLEPTALDHEPNELTLLLYPVSFTPSEIRTHVDATKKHCLCH